MSIIMTLHLAAWSLSAIPPSFSSSILIRKQLCTADSIRGLHGKLLRQPLPSRSSVCTRLATSKIRSSQHIKRPIDTVYGTLKMQHRSSSTNSGPSRLPHAKKANKSDHTQTAGSNSGSRLSESNASMTIWQKFLAPKPMPERYSALWYREIVLICTVFAITGSTTMIVRILF